MLCQRWPPCDVCVGGKSQFYGTKCEIMCNNDNLFFFQPPAFSGRTSQECFFFNILCIWKNVYQCAKHLLTMSALLSNWHLKPSGSAGSVFK